jgi:hypothetical protein
LVTQVKWQGQVTDRLSDDLSNWRVKQSGYCHLLLREWFCKRDGFRVFCSPQKIINF